MNNITKKQVLNYLEKISPKDKVLIIHDDDLDGFTSSIIVQNWLEKRKIKSRQIAFTAGGNQNYLLKKSKKSTKTILLDLGDNKVEKFLKKSKNKILYVDHHPKRIDLPKNVLRYTNDKKSSVAKILYEILETNPLTEILALIADTGDREKENQKRLSEIKKEQKISDEEIIKRIKFPISRTIIYYWKKPNKAYDKIKSIKSINQIRKLDKYDKLIEREIQRILREYKLKKRKIGKVKYFFFKPKFPIKSAVISEISFKKPSQTFIFATPDSKNRKIVSISARSQNKNIDTIKLLQTCTKNFKNALSGGHVPASGARIRKRDFGKFLKNLARY